MKLLAIALLLAGVQETKQAEDLYKEALAQAKESKKKVFLAFGSPG